MTSKRPAAPNHAAGPECPETTCKLSDVSNRAVDLFKVLADPTRLKLLYTVAESHDGAICSFALGQALGVSPPTVTHHMKKLIRVDLVRREQRGKWAYYSVNPNHFYRVHDLISRL
ncbi:ArsR/SmtB family transcription factor [Corynebacterium mendelii]|uniref:Helix-turn-helix transcriptional regulator n=1 Tax=Corynebacterium mendelii TaxID=2765362 RepID=A0A939IXQ4_9CORY|nr:metalloregulator ArsR/SmtB family transcription factor [Corynebacterium mendelii]MBN9643897.1 helix-turn-helix transcriptional regulator [Corynebacterium mendelii]